MGIAPTDMPDTPTLLLFPVGTFLPWQKAAADWFPTPRDAQGRA